MKGLRVIAALAVLALTLPFGSAQAATVNDKLEVGGYVQTRFEAFENAEDGTNTVNGFLLRRARLTIKGKPTNRVLVKIELAADKGQSSSVKDAFVQYFLRPGWTGASVSAGQMKYPFGHEIQESSRDRLAPERARWVAALFPEYRDKGLVLATDPGKQVSLVLGVFNGTGTAAADNNNDKDLAGRLQVILVPGVLAGGSIYVGNAYDSYYGNQSKKLYGADVVMLLGDLELKGEFVTGDLEGAKPQGWMAQAAYTQGRNILVVRFDTIDDDELFLLGEELSGRGRLSSWNLGWVHSLGKGVKTKLFYEINREKNYSFANNVVRAEVVAGF